MPPESRVSIVEDDESLRVALVGLLRSVGYRAEGFESAEQFLAQGAVATDCIVTDIQMPGLGGIEMTARLRGAGSTVPVVMITARTEPTLDEKARASGAICLLRKPFEANELIEHVEKAIETGCDPLAKRV